jgi:hypothetical protein
VSNIFRMSSEDFLAAALARDIWAAVGVGAVGEVVEVIATTGVGEATACAAVAEPAVVEPAVSPTQLRDDGMRESTMLVQV